MSRAAIHAGSAQVSLCNLWGGSPSRRGQNTKTKPIPKTKAKPTSRKTRMETLTRYCVFYGRQRVELPFPQLGAQRSLRSKHAKLRGIATKEAKLIVGTRAASKIEKYTAGHSSFFPVFIRGTERHRSGTAHCNKGPERESLTHKLSRKDRELSCSKHLVSQVSQRPESKNGGKSRQKTHTLFAAHLSQSKRS